MPPITGLFPFKARLLLWVIAQALPDPEAVKDHMHKLLLSVIAAAMVGVFGLFAVALLITSGYYYLLSEGLSQGPALGVIGIICFVLATSIYLLMRQWLNDGLNITSSLQQPEHSGTDVWDEVGEALLKGFMSGFTEEDARPKPSAEPLPEKTNGHATGNTTLHH